MGKSQRDKGARAERELARLLEGERVPLSGSAGGSFGGDVRALGLLWESKVEGSGFRRLYAWLQERDALAVKADRKPWLVVLPLQTFLRLVRGTNTQPPNPPANLAAPVQPGGHSGGELQ